MLGNASAINKYAIEATDGPIGTVSDFLFDDAHWKVRWLVVDTGHWLPGRHVLLPPSVMGHVDPSKEEFAVRLTMQEVKASPDIDAHQPVSRQMETNLYDHYGWSPYWGTDFYMGGYGYVGGPISTLPSSEELRRDQQRRDRLHANDDPHLRSVEAVTGYHIHATDGEIGHVEDFLVEDVDWSIHYLVVDTKNWWPGKKVLVSPRSARAIDWSEKLVNLDVDRQAVKNSPTYDATTMIDRGYEKKFHHYYDDIRPNPRS